MDIQEDKKKLRKIKLDRGFPYEDLEAIRENYIKDMKEENDLTEDFNNFSLLVAGSVSYAVSNKKIPPYQKELLKKDFYETFPQYSFLKSILPNYPDLYKELRDFEEARVLLLNFE